MKGLNHIEQIRVIVEQHRTSDFIDLAAGIPSELPTASLMHGLRTANPDEIGRYTTIQGLPELRKHIAEKFYQQLALDKNQVLITVGAKEAITIAIVALVKKQDEVIIITPDYYTFRNTVRMVGGKVVECRLSPTENGRIPKYYLDLKKIESKITSKTKLLIINSPHNPTGWVIDKSTSQALAKLADRHKFYILSDEVYRSYVYDGTFSSPIEYSKRVIVADSISKSFAASGFRLGWLVTQDCQLMEKFLWVHDTIVISANSAAQYATAYALKQKDCTENITERIAEYGERRKLCLRLLRAIPSLTPIEGQGAFYIFVKYKNDIGSFELCKRLIKEKHIAVAPGIAFGKQFDHYFRLAYVLPSKKLCTGIQRLREFFVE